MQACCLDPNLVLRNYLNPFYAETEFVLSKNRSDKTGIPRKIEYSSSLDRF
ncbi:hypothetical protein KCTC52924_00212 [Arenibacter antarcticus]